MVYYSEQIILGISSSWALQLTEAIKPEMWKMETNKGLAWNVDLLYK